MLDFRQLWSQALSYDHFIAESTENVELWTGVYKTARVPPWAIDAVGAGAPRKLLVLTEDWCGDASNTTPVLVRLAEQAPNLEIRLLRRDEHPEVMDQYLTNGSRSIPIVIALDDAFREVGHWGPRPTELQAWVMAHRAMPSGERYREVRRWYAKDHGETTLREVLAAAQNGKQ